MHGLSPIEMATKSGAHKVMRLLISMGADLSHDFNRVNGWTLTYAIENQDSVAVKLLIESGTDPNFAIRQRPHFPLLFAGASSVGLAHGPNAGQTDIESHAEIIKILLKAGANPDERAVFNGKEITPRNYASKMQSNFNRDGENDIFWLHKLIEDYDVELAMAAPKPGRDKRIDD